MPASRAHRNALRVLAVDDSAEMRILVEATLERRGYSVQSVDCGTAAIAAASREPFDLVILDVDMPGLDGLEVGRALRDNPQTRAALIAMHTSLDEAEVRCGFDGYDLFLPKPCCPQRLGECVDQLLQGARARRELAPAG
jgi:two-component system alkaline phosphatase synthesis response regulator PhoP